MDATALKKVLEEAVDKTATPPTLPLDTGVIPDIPDNLARDLKNACGSKKALTVASPKLDEDGKTVTVSGSAALLDLPDVRVTVSLTPEDGAVGGQVTASLKNGSDVTVPGFDWLTWKKFDLNATFPPNGTPASGSIDARLGPLDIGLGGLLNPDFQWTLTPKKTELADLTLESFLSADAYVAFLDLLIDMVSDLTGLKVSDAELLMDPGKSNCLTLTTEFDWEVLPEAHVRNLGLSVTSLSGPDAFPLPPRSGLQGEIQLGSINPLAFDAGLAKATKGPRFDFDLKTLDGTPLTIGDLSAPFLDMSFEELPLPGNLGTRIKNSGFSELAVDMAPEDKEFGFLAQGDLLGLTGSVRFRVQPVNQKPNIRFTLACTNDPMPLAGILKKTLMIPVDPSVEEYLPKSGLALRELTFDQVEKLFRLTGLIQQGNPAHGKTAWSVDGKLETSWKDGIRLDFNLDASAAPVTLDGLLADLPFSLEPAKSVVPAGVVTKIGETAFYGMGLHLDLPKSKPDKTIEISGAASLFGSIYVSAALGLYEKDKKRFVTLDATVRSETLNLKKLPHTIGADGLVDDKLIALLPDIGLGLEHVALDQEKKDLSIKGRLEIGDTGATAAVTVKGQDQEKTALIHLQFDGDTDSPPSFTAFLGAVTGMDPASINILGLNILLTKVDLKLDTGTRKLSGEAHAAVTFSKARLNLTAKSEKQAEKSDAWVFSGKQEKDLQLKDVADDIAEQLGVPSLPPGLPAIIVKDLAFSFNTASNDMTFRMKTQTDWTLPGFSKEITIDTYASLASKSGKDDKRNLEGCFSGSLELSPALFQVYFDFDEKKRVFQAAWEADKAGGSLTFRKVAEALGLSVGSDLPKLLDPGLRKAAFEYAPGDTKNQFRFVAQTGNGMTLFFIALKDKDAQKDKDNKWQFVVGLDYDEKIKDEKGITDLFPGIELVTVKQASLMYATASLKEFEVPTLPALKAGEAPGKSLIQGKQMDIQKGLMIAADFRLDPVELGDTSLELENVYLMFARQKETPKADWKTEAKVRGRLVAGSGSQTLTVSVEADYTAEKEKEKNLSFTGEFEATPALDLKQVMAACFPPLAEIPDDIVALRLSKGSLSFNSKPNSKSLTFSLDLESRLGFPDMFSLDTTHLDLKYDKAESACWEFTAKGSLSVPAIDLVLPDQEDKPLLSGTLKFIHTEKTMKIAYTADENAAELILPLLCPGGPDLDRLVRAGTAIKTFEVGKEDKVWGCRAKADLDLYDVAPPLDRLLSRDEPEKVGDSTRIRFLEGGLAITQQGLSLSLGTEEKPLLDFPIPDPIKAINDSLPKEVSDEFRFPEIGDGLMELTALELSVKKKELSVGILFGLGLPANLNNLIGLGDTPLILTYGDYRRLKPAYADQLIKETTDEKKARDLKRLKSRRYKKAGNLVEAVRNILGRDFKVDAQKIQHDKGLVHGRIKLSKDGIGGQLLNFPILFENFLRGISETEKTVDLDLREMFGGEPRYRVGDEKSEAVSRLKKRIDGAVLTKVETLKNTKYEDTIAFRSALRSAGLSETDLEKDEKAIFNCCDGRVDYGKFSINKPEFSLDMKKGSFKAAGGYHIDPDRKLMIPLFPVKRLLTLIGQTLMADTLPDGIVVESVHFFDEHDHLKVDELENFFRWMGIELPPEVMAIIREVKVLADNLPERFKEYLSINIPQGLEFAVDVTGDGSISFDLKVSDDSDPLQVLCCMLPYPQFMGVRLRRLAFGTALSNSLLKVEVDGEIDNFDLVSLAGAVLLPLVDIDEVQQFLPETDRFRTTFTARDLLIIIIYETEIPIPIPLFYDRLEFSYAGLEGMEVRTAIAFPAPRFNAQELLKRLNDIRKFFTTPYEPGVFDKDGTEKGLLHIEHYGRPTDRGDYGDPGDAEMDVRFYMGPFFVRLAKLLDIEDTPYFELTQDNYEALEKKISEKSFKAIRDMRKQRFLTETGFKYQVRMHIGDSETEQKAVVDQCRAHKNMGQLIGIPSTRLMFSLWDLLYLVLNSMKKLSLNYTIQFFHIDDRMGTFDLHLFHLFKYQVDWVFATPWEFTRKRITDKKRFTGLQNDVPVIWQALADEKYMDLYGNVDPGFYKLTDSSQMNLPVGLEKDRAAIYDRLFNADTVCTRFLNRIQSTHVPQSPAEELLLLLTDNDTGEAIAETDEGLATFLRGAMEVADGIVLLESAIGLMVDGVTGFRTGFSFRGYVADVVDVKLLGYLKISPKSKQEVFKLLGKSSLTVFDRRIMYGLFDLTVGDNTHFHVEGDLDLFPEAWPVKVKGHVVGHIGSDKFLYDAAAWLELGALKANTRLRMEAVKPRVEISAHIEFLHCLLAAGIRGQAGSTGAALDLDLQLNALNIIVFHADLHAAADLESGASVNGSSRLDISIPTPWGDNLDVVHTELDFSGAFDPNAGFLGFAAGISRDSYILTPACRISGGIAYYMWFSGEHSGDFCFSLGGYHPHYRRPSHYPVVPPIAIDWQLLGNIHIRGSAYFTLTPSCIMVGGGLDFQWHLGGLKAWFTAHIDFLLAWQPFYFDARVSISMGVSYTFSVFGIRKTLGFHIGAGIALWGPDQNKNLAGRADVDLGIVSFSISFGHGRPGGSGRVENWAQFRQRFLPQGNLCSLTANGGLVKAVDTTAGLAKDPATAEDKVWVINPHEFRLRIGNVVPVTGVTGVTLCRKTEKDQDTLSCGKPGVAAMGVKASEFHSVLTVSVSQVLEEGGEEHPTPCEDEFCLSPIHGNAAKALWGESADPDLNPDYAVVKNTVQGFDIRPKNPDRYAAPSSPYDIKTLQLPSPVDNAFDWCKGKEARKLERDGRKEIADTLAATQGKRDDLLTGLGYDPKTFCVEHLTKSSVEALLYAPEVWTWE